MLEIHANQLRTEGPTPNGGTYAIGSFSHDGAPCEPRFANRVEITEYDEGDKPIARSYGALEPEEALPAEPE